MIYWDTSCLLKLYVHESDSEFWTTQAVGAEDHLVASALVDTELSLTLARKEARGDIRGGSAAVLTDLFHDDVAQGRFRLFPVGTDVLSMATELGLQCAAAGRPELLRTLDGIHLATAHLLRCTAVATTDRRMREAAELLGMPLV